LNSEKEKGFLSVRWNKRSKSFLGNATFGREETPPLRPKMKPNKNGNQSNKINLWKKPKIRYSRTTFGSLGQCSICPSMYIHAHMYLWFLDHLTNPWIAFEVTNVSFV
jgi:hypothetical protein